MLLITSLPLGAVDPIPKLPLAENRPRSANDDPSQVLNVRADASFTFSLALLIVAATPPVDVALKPI